MNESSTIEIEAPLVTSFHYQHHKKMSQDIQLQEIHKKMALQYLFLDRRRKHLNQREW